MTFLEQLDRIEKLDHLIRTKATGSPKDLSRRMNITELLLYDMLRIMKERGAPIYFDKKVNSYRYRYEGSFAAKFTPGER